MCCLVFLVVYFLCSRSTTLWWVEAFIGPKLYIGSIALFSLGLWYLI